MAAWRRAIELSLGEADTAKLRSIAQSRTNRRAGWSGRTSPAYREDPYVLAVGRALGLHHQTVSPAYRPSQRPPPTCRPSPACMTFAREHEYKRHGTISLLASIDSSPARSMSLVKDRHRSREFIEFLKLLDAAYRPTQRSS